MSTTVAGTTPPLGSPLGLPPLGSPRRARRRRRRARRQIVYYILRMELDSQFLAFVFVAELGPLGLFAPGGPVRSFYSCNGFLIHGLLGWYGCSERAPARLPFGGRFCYKTNNGILTVLLLNRRVK